MSAAGPPAVEMRLPELISIVDCDLCVTLAPDQKVLDLPLPETWGRLSTILYRGSWEQSWSPDPARCASALDIEEVRVCRACGTHYHYRQVHDSHFGEPRPPETEWYLERLPPTHARRFVRQADPGGAVQHLDGGWLEQRYETILGLLHRDLSRAPDWRIKRYMVASLFFHYLGTQDWEGLKAALVDHPDPAVGVYVAYWILAVADPGPDISALRWAEPTREPLLVGVLAGGLSERGQSLGFTAGEEEPIAVSAMAMRTLRTYVPRQSLAPAVPALAAALQRADDSRGWREAARDLLIEYVGAAPERASEVLEALEGGSDETFTVRAHCQRCLAESARW